MPETRCDVLVAGAGPAGLAAACRAAECGARVLLVDDNPQPGGQIWRASGGEPANPAARWLRIAAARKVQFLAGARLFAAPEPGCVAVEQAGETSLLVRYRGIVLATGARERFLPFPGWTLPNVTGAGGLQALVKSGWPIAGKKVVVAGSGPLLPAVACYLRARGAGIRLVAEQAGRRRLARCAVALARYPRKLLQAAGLFGSLRGVPYRASCWPIAARGTERLESVELRQGNRTWTEPCDYLACAFGLVPNTELALLLGCPVGDAGVLVNDYQETAVPGVYCAGEAAGIGGLELAIVEGEIAGLAAAGQGAWARRLFPARRAWRGFARELERAFALRTELRELPRDQTPVCRCEDVPWGLLRPCASWRAAKLHTRCGMGACQGRVCGAALDFLSGWKEDSVRPPVFPVRVASLGQDDAPAAGQK